MPKKRDSKSGKKSKDKKKSKSRSRSRESKRRKNKKSKSRSRSRESKKHKKSKTKKSNKKERLSREKDEPKIDYEPIVCKVPEGKEKISSLEISPKYSVSYPPPRLDLGFNHFIHSLKDKMELTSKGLMNKKSYNIVLPFETAFSDTSTEEASITSIEEKSKSIFKKKPEILSRGFYKMWEMINLCDLLSSKSKSITTAHLAEAPGGFAQATMYYREMHSDGKIDDKYYGISMSDTNQDQTKKLDEEFMDAYKKNKTQVFIPYKGCKAEKKSGKKGDLTDPVCIKNFGEQFEKSKADFVTADGGFDWFNENIQEQESIKLIIGQICTAIKIQNKGGNFVIKFFETFTGLAVKLILLLTECYESVYIVKPLTSRESNSEKYIVCKNFNLSSKEANKVSDKLLSVLDGMTSKQIYDIFPEYELSSSTKGLFSAINTEISNKQAEAINKIIKYLKSDSMFGPEFDKYKENQIKANQYWNSLFFNVDHKHTQKMTQMIQDLVLTKSENRVKEFTEMIKK